MVILSTTLGEDIFDDRAIDRIWLVTSYNGLIVNDACLSVVKLHHALIDAINIILLSVFEIIILAFALIMEI